MYYRDNGKIIEDFKIEYYDGSDTCRKTPSWIIIVLVILLLIFISMTFYSIFKKHKK